MTIAEKIFARHWVPDAAKGKIGIPAVQPGDQGFVRTDIRFSHEYVTPMAAIFFEELVGKDEPVNDPVVDVLLPRSSDLPARRSCRPEHVADGAPRRRAISSRRSSEEFAAKQGVKLYGESNRLTARRALGPGSEAICHSKILEAHAEPGQIIIGTDSHTPHCGRGRVHRLRRRHDGDLQLLDHEGRARRGAANRSRSSSAARSRAT